MAPISPIPLTTLPYDNATIDIQSFKNLLTPTVGWMLLALWCLIQIAPNLQWSQPPCRGGHIPNWIRSLKFLRYESANFCNLNFFFFSSLSFRTFCKNCYNSYVRARIWMKFGTCIRGLKKNTRIDFRVNLINIQWIISDFMHKVKSNFCYAYSVNLFGEQADIWYEAIRGAAFCG